MSEFLKNAWYCAAWSSELGDEPMARKLLDKPILLYRKEDGTPVATSNLCPHRFAPLDKGKVINDSIECPYHGLRFGPDGICNHNPHADGKIPKAAKIDMYTLHETQGVIWIWMGDPENADSSTIVDTGFLLDTDNYSNSYGVLEVKANYLMVTDNLLDLTHAPYVHANTVGGKPEDSIGNDIQFSFEPIEEEKRVISRYFCSGMPPTPQLSPLTDLVSGDFRVIMDWKAPSNLVMNLSFTGVGADEKEGVILPLLHLLTPIDINTTRYFFAIARNVLIDDIEQDKIMTEFARLAFETEDEPMIHACQEQMGTTDLFSLNPVMLATDVANIRARRVLDQMIAAENNVA